MSGELELDMDSVVTAFTHYNATKYVQTAATMWVGWDCILTFDREVVFFWQTKWTFLKILFIVNRYLPLLGAAWNTSVLLQPELTDRYCWLFHTSLQSSILTSSFEGNIGLRIMGQVLAIVSVAVFHAMLIVIINAMYKDSRLVRYGLLTLFLTTHLSASLVVGFAGRSAKYIVNPLSGLHMCTSTQRARYIWVAWIIPIVFEIAAYVLAVKKSWFYISGTPFRHRSSLMQLLKVMLRDWSVYILFIIPAYMVMAVVFALSPVSVLVSPFIDLST